MNTHKILGNTNNRNTINQDDGNDERDEANTTINPTSIPQRRLIIGVLRQF